MLLRRRLEGLMGGSGSVGEANNPKAWLCGGVSGPMEWEEGGLRTRRLAGDGFRYVRISDREWPQVTKSGSWPGEWAEGAGAGTEAVRF